MFVVECPQAAGGRRLLGERTITGLSAVSGGWLLSARCTCGAEHAVRVPVAGRGGSARAQVVG